jgi:hypothetical protein
VYVGFTGAVQASNSSFGPPVENNQGVAKTGNFSVCHTTTEPSGLALKGQ